MFVVKPLYQKGWRDFNFHLTLQNVKPTTEVHNEMKKIIKIVFIIIAVLVLLIALAIAAFLLLAAKKNATYWEYATPNGEIETKYTGLGSCEVSSAEFEAADTVWAKYEVWYPSELKTANTSYPMVIMANGTGTKASQYQEVFKRLASWGFIVVGNEDENCRTGASSAATLDFMLVLNADPSNDFYGKIDTENIGIAGHSQGGVGAINAVTGQENGDKYKAIWSISATSRYHANGLNENGLEGSDGTSGSGWNIDVTKINVPIMMVAGTGLFDAGNLDEYTPTIFKGEAQGICPIWWLNECYNTIPDSVDKVIARQIGKDHADMLRSGDGYMTAWFMYYLKGDMEAGKAFFGENAEILSNKNWQDVTKNR